MPGPTLPVPRRRLPGALLALTVTATLLMPAAQPAAAAPAMPPGFSETVAFNGLTNPTVVKFARDGRVFVAEKSGLVKVFDSLTDPTPDVFADLRTEVHNFWDRGLLGFELHPDFPANPSVYVLYTRDAEIGGTPPRWGTAGTSSDGCPNPPGATANGCVVSGRLSRLEAAGNAVKGPEQPLVTDWCQQYPSHSVGALAFGSDRMLYASAGDGASFTFTDYGQNGSPKNPCGDPPGGVGATLTPPTAEGGALRSQDLRSTGDPVGLDGTVIRIDPATGAGAPGNPLAASLDPNARRIVASGLRNPFRFAFRPGTNELWIGDVGWTSYEEINRLPNPTDGAVDNFGWPCYEGRGRQAGYDGADLGLCERLYAAGPGAVTPPVFAYHHQDKVVSGETCGTGSSSVAGLAFQFYEGGPYPPQYDGALFFADYSRNCIWTIFRGDNGLPDPATRAGFVTGAAGPVNLEIGPGGDLFYVDFGGGTIRRIRFVGEDPPLTCPTGEFKADYYSNATLAGSPAFSRCEAAIANNWGSGGPGGGLGTDNFSVRWSGRHPFAAGEHTFTARADDGIRVRYDGGLIIDAWRDQAPTTYVATAVAPTAGEREVVVEYYEKTGGAVAEVSWRAGNDPPVPVIDSPGAGTGWTVGERITFSGRATDAEDGTLPPSSLSWSLVLQHCPGTCHAHPLQTYPGVAGGAFDTPDHDYPSHLELRLTATDSAGASRTVTRRLDPRTVGLAFATDPPGLGLTVGGTTQAAPFTRTVIVGSANTVSAPTPQTVGGTTYDFVAWSDGGSATHTVVAGATGTTTTATYRARTATWQPFARVNFQPAAAPGAAGYLVDAGNPFGTRGGGRRYGWNADLRRYMVDRNSSRSPDQRYDTLARMQAPNPDGVWEMAVPNGQYRVRVVAGDPSYTGNATRITVEGTLAVSGKTTSSRRWLDGTVTVTVADGRLTIGNGVGATNNKISFVDIDALAG